MKEIKQVKAKDFDSEAFQRKEFRIVMDSPKSVSRTLKFLHENGFVWGNTKTSLLEDDTMKESLSSASQYYPVYIIAGGDMCKGVLIAIVYSLNIPAVELIFEDF